MPCCRINSQVLHAPPPTCLPHGAQLALPPPSSPLLLCAGGYAGVRRDGLHIDSHADCISAPGLKHVLCSSWGDDNLGKALPLSE